MQTVYTVLHKTSDDQPQNTHLYTVQYNRGIIE